jgi:hypothetical protein
MIRPWVVTRLLAVAQPRQGGTAPKFAKVVTAQTSLSYGPFTGLSGSFGLLWKTRLALYGLERSRIVVQRTPVHPGDFRKWSKAPSARPRIAP